MDEEIDEGEDEDSDEKKRRKASVKTYKPLPKTKKTIAVRDHDRIPYSGRLALIGLVLSSIIYDKAVKDDDSIDIEDFPTVESWKMNDSGLVDAIIKWPKSEVSKKLVFNLREVIHSMGIAVGENGTDYKTNLMEFGTKGDKLDHGIIATLARIKLAEDRLTAFQWATQGLRELNNAKGTGEEYSHIYSQLWQGIARAYQDLFIWGNLIGEDTREYAKNLALRKFVSDSDGIARLMNFTDSWMGAYYTEDEDRLREEIKALAKKEEKKNKWETFDHQMGDR